MKEFSWLLLIDALSNKQYVGQTADEVRHRTIKRITQESLKEENIVRKDNIVWAL